jgi:transposase InsO family protein
MSETHKLEEKEHTPKPPRGLSRRDGRPSYSFEIRLKAVKLRLEEGFPTALIIREMGIGPSTLAEWVRCYRREGEAGLQHPAQSIRLERAARARLAPAVRQHITALKQQQPALGVKKIAQMLRRWLLLPVSRETVRRVLHQKQLIEKVRRKPRRNPPKPRFFERATPNQMWQSDICTIRLGGQNAYLIGFMDDHSRYMVGLGLYRSQTAEHVLDVYRQAVGEFGLPKEVLTDNGRQYTNWRGKTRFEQALQKDHVHHFRSSPHHPQTLGKIERFWKTIWTDFLARAQFDSFEQAQARVRKWVQFYNHRRPHQSLDDLCPADRFFALAPQLRAVIERGIAANVEELALRGVPRSPFYMVGRLGEQSVVLRAEKGQITMQIDGETQPLNQLTYQLNQPTGEPTYDAGNQTQEGPEGVQCPPTRASSTRDLDGAAAPGGSLPADEHQQRAAGPVAGAGDGRDVGRVATALSDGTATGPGADREVGAPAGAADITGGRQASQAGETPGQTANGAGGECAEQREVTLVLVEPKETSDGTDTECAGNAGTAPGGLDCPSAMRPDHRDRSGESIGRESQDVLRVGEEGAAGAGELPAGSAGRPAGDTPRSGEGNAPTADPGIAGTNPGPGADAGDSATVGGTHPR